MVSIQEKIFVFSQISETMIGPTIPTKVIKTKINVKNKLCFEFHVAK